MCSEIDHFSSFLRKMSGGNNNPKIFPLEKSLESPPQIAPQSAEEREREKVADRQPEEVIKNEDEAGKATASNREIEEEEDGFRTPTSFDHRIPAITECPPAPKKLRPPLSKLKRKASPGSSRSIHLDSSAEVESFFCPTASDQNDAQQEKIKKPRRESDDKDRP